LFLEVGWRFWFWLEIWRFLYPASELTGLVTQPQEYADARDADEAVRDMEGYRLNGNKIAVEFSRSQRDRDDYRRGGGGGRYDDRRGSSRYDDRDRDRDYDRDRHDDRDRDYRDRDRERDRDYDRDRDRDRHGERRGRNPYSRFSPPYNTENRVVVTDLPPDCSWQDLKDYFRTVGDVCFTDVKRGRGVVEFKTSDAVKEAVKKLDRTKLRSYTINVAEDKGPGGGGGRGRSQSPSPSPRKRGRSPSPRGGKSSPRGRSASPSPKRARKSPSPSDRKEEEQQRSVTLALKDALEASSKLLGEGVRVRTMDVWVGTFLSSQ